MVIFEVVTHGLVPVVKNRMEAKMKTWKKPVSVEIAVGTEINSYSCAAL